MNAAEIARGLTKAQREAVLSFGDHVKRFHERRHSSSYHSLDCKRLIERKWSPFPTDRLWVLTPLGLEVRAILEQEARDGE